jgi:dihydrofolate reductase
LYNKSYFVLEGIIDDHDIWKPLMGRSCFRWIQTWQRIDVLENKTNANVSFSKNEKSQLSTKVVNYMSYIYNNQLNYGG